MTPAPLAIDDAASIMRLVRTKDAQALIALTGDQLSLAAAGEMLVCAMWSSLLGVDLPGRGTNYLKQETRFLAPVPLDGWLTAEVRITRVRADKGLVDLATTCFDADGRLIAEGRALVQARDTARLPQP